MNETDIIRVYIPNGSVKSVRYDFETKVQRVIHVVLASLGIDKVSYGHFALRLVQFPTAHTSNNDCYWLHGSFTMRHIYEKYFSTSASCSQLRFELRLRFVPKDLQEMYQTQTDAFMFLHDQVLADYLTQVSIEQHHRFRITGKLMCALDKCFNLEELEAEGVLTRYLPETIVVNTKPKALRKSLLAAVKRNAALSPTECMFQFLNIVLKVSQFDVEIFRASLGVSWTTPIDIFVGMRFYNQLICFQPTPVTQLRNIVEISIRKLDETSEKAIVQLRLTGSNQPMVCDFQLNSITVPNSLIAESLAHLLDGYQMLLSQQGSVWTPKELMCNTLTSEFITQCDSLKHHLNRENESEESTFLAKAFSLSSDLRIDRSRVSLEELLGDGQFGNVYRGTHLLEDGSSQAVAVKVCKIDSEPSEMQNFLEEALVMRRFHHSHIIKLIGICTEMPVWIVMELAPFGELRHYLMRNRAVIDLSILLLYSQQLSSAISYLHSCKFVHRDIAARNVLVSTARSVKLSDFGMSRCVQEESFYTSSRGKLPIKWMAPESINYRRFNTATDIWMFGVCVWEILMYGIKPWQDVRNHDVILKLEAEERLAKPENCPQVLYDFLRRMWAFDAKMRPTIGETNRFLNHLLDQIDCGIPFNELRAPCKEVCKLRSTFFSFLTT
ncbi:unnamed protein product [Toxocara canis]|uniref:receptor protein-tyrosine kinase n=1 Tax=Toxocara canis TaxID=6265 RepID=A0A183UDT3_TOXCA|nr:unnamed protein product [Toxocara canis]